MVSSIYRVLAYLVAAGVAIEAAAIAFAAYGLLDDVDNGVIVDKTYVGNVGFDIHAGIGQFIIPLLAIALLITAIFAKIPGAVRWAGYVLGTTIVQVALGMFAHTAASLGTLHGLLALLLLILTLIAARRKGTPSLTTDAEAGKAGVG